MPWHQKTGASVLLRVAGAGILGIAYLAGASLRSRAIAGPVNGDPFAYLLAAATFICGSAGTVLAALGAHIFDRVVVSQRWRRPSSE